MDRSDLIRENAWVYTQAGQRVQIWRITADDGCYCSDLKYHCASTLSAAPPPPADSEDAKAFQDMLDTGTGFMLDGKRIAPERVRVVTPPPAEQSDPYPNTGDALAEFVTNTPQDVMHQRLLKLGWTPPAEQASGEHVEVLRSLRRSPYICSAQAAALDAAIAALSQRPVVGEAERDRDRLDYIEREGISVSCQWKNTGWAGGPKWQAYVYGTGGKVFADGDTLRATIDALAPQQPTGEEG